MDQQALTHRQHTLSLTLALATLCAQYATLAMATTPDKANWNNEETASFVDYLHEHWSEITNFSMFKMTTFNTTAQYIARLLILTPMKMGKICKTK